jgi:protein-tyrosine phosphatase
MYQITKRLFVGNIDEMALPLPPIGAVLLVAEECRLETPPWVSAAKIPLKEFARPDVERLGEAVAWIEQQLKENIVMVCCRAGVSRSVSVVVAYLCCVEGNSYDEALRLVMTQRPGALPLPQLEETIELVRHIRRATPQPSAIRDKVQPPR